MLRTNCLGLNQCSRRNNDIKAVLLSTGLSLSIFSAKQLLNSL